MCSAIMPTSGHVFDEVDDRAGWAAGGIESVAVMKSITESVIPPTINLENPDEGFDLDFAPNEAKQRDIKYALNNSFGFGGHNVSLVFGKAP